MIVDLEGLFLRNPDHSKWTNLPRRYKDRGRGGRGEVEREGCAIHLKGLVRTLFQYCHFVSILRNILVLVAGPELDMRIP